MNYATQLCKGEKKTKHNQTKKHKYYSNLILNRCFIKNVKVNEFKVIFNPYFIEHTKKFVYFSVQVILNFDDDCFRHKISVSNNVTYNIESENYSTYTTESASDFYIELYQFTFLMTVLLK